MGGRQSIGQEYSVHYDKLKYALAKGTLLNGNIPAIAEHFAPEFKVWVPASVRKQGLGVNPKTLIVCDVHYMHGDEMFLKHHKDMETVFRRLLDRGVIQLGRDKFLFEPTGATFMQGEVKCVYGTVPTGSYKRPSTFGRLRVYPEFNNQAVPSRKVLALDKRHVFARLYETFKAEIEKNGKAPYAEVIASNDMIRYHDLLAEITAAEQDDDIREQFLEFNEALYAMARAKAERIAANSGDHVTFAVIGMTDMFFIDFEGIRKKEKTLDHICLIPSQECP